LPSGLAALELPYDTDKDFARIANVQLD